MTEKLHLCLTSRLGVEKTLLLTIMHSVGEGWVIWTSGKIGPPRILRFAVGKRTRALSDYKHLTTKPLHAKPWRPPKHVDGRARILRFAVGN
jgi:hypothetical protein